jgi:hypothetical protein
MITVDKELRDKSNGLTRVVIFTDEAGRNVGRFLPEAEYAKYMKWLYDRAKLMVTDEELDRARREPGGRTLAEIWERLGTGEPDRRENLEGAE